MTKDEHTAMGLVAKVKRVVRDYGDTSMGTHASSTAYFVFSSLIPVVIIIACIMSHSGLSEASLVEFTSFLEPEALYEIVATVIREAYANSDLALSVSLGALLWTASSGSTALARGLNAVYDVEEERDWIHRTVVSLLSVIVLIALLVGAIYLIFRGKVIRMLAMAMPGMIEPNVLENLSSTLVMLGVGILIFSLCYTYLPSGTREFKQ